MVELCLAPHQAGSCNLLELTPALQNVKTSSLKIAEVQADLVETVETAFQHLKGSETGSHNWSGSSRTREEVAVVCCCGKSKKKKVRL